MNLLEGFDDRMIVALVFLGVLLIFAVLMVVLMIRGIIRSRRYHNEALPSLIDLGLSSGSEDDDNIKDVFDDNDTYAFAISDDDEFSAGDAEADTLLREVNEATRMQRHENTKQKRGFFSRKR